MFLTKLNEVLASKKSFVSDRINFASLSTASLLNIIHWVILYSKIKPSQSNLLLHYNVVYGADVIGKSIYLYWIPLLALILLILNTTLAIAIYQREKLAAYFINVASVAVQVVFLVASIVLILIND